MPYPSTYTILSIDQLEDRCSPAILALTPNVVIVPPSPPPPPPPDPGDPVVVSPMPPPGPGTQSNSTNGGYA